MSTPATFGNPSECQKWQLSWAHGVASVTGLRLGMGHLPCENHMTTLYKPQNLAAKNFNGFSSIVKQVFRSFKGFFTKIYFSQNSKVSEMKFYQKKAEDWRFISPL